MCSLSHSLHIWIAGRTALHVAALCGSKSETILALESKKRRCLQAVFHTESQQISDEKELCEATISDFGKSTNPKVVALLSTIMSTTNAVRGKSKLGSK
jgi:hypothetical protein